MNRTEMASKGLIDCVGPSNSRGARILYDLVRVDGSPGGKRSARR
jgi:hypothetical protein